MVVPLLRGLMRAHSARALHRDIRLANIIIRRTVSDESRRSALIDLGCRKASSRRA